MANKLVIVESPTKARTITRFLHGQAEVLASMGHVRDLPDHDFGVDIANGFQPAYRLTANGKKVMGKLKQAAAKAKAIYLATDPDREGEAIAWHLQEVLAEGGAGPFHRVSFHEITQSAIDRAFAEAETVDLQRVDAQQARRILDRLVGYKVSPLLWKNIRRGTSAGRVQSVALRLVVERERQIQAFVPEEYWNLTATFLPDQPPQSFPARLFKLDGNKPVVGDAETAQRLADELEASAFAVADTASRQKQQYAAPPFITSTLQQAAGGRLRFAARQTMQIAQQLYEGVELGADGAVGLITYMRTDSVAVATEAQEAARQFVAATYGPEYVPAKPNVYRSRQSAQAAHEAIRPTDVSRTPERLAGYLKPQQLKLYQLIWNRFVASQMAPARLQEYTIDVKAVSPGLAHDYLFRATATQTLFPGFTRVLDNRTIEDDGENDEGTPRNLPQLTPGQPCQLEKIDRQQKFTEPPRRFSEATLVKELEENGVGRPSTYAAILHTIQERTYVAKEKAALVPTELGFAVNDYLVASMPELFDIGFTANMEQQLDEIEEGKIGMRDMLEEFYGKFRNWVSDVQMLHAPAPEACAELLATVPAGFAWPPAEKRGRQTYDDGKFFASIKEQLEGGKKLSDKQWIAVLGLVARHAERLPKLPATLATLGLEEEFAAAAAAQQQRRQQAEARAALPATPSSAKAKALVEAMAKINFAPAETRRKRTYDDKKFFDSLRRQVKADQPLSEAQENALARLAIKYADQIAAFAELAERFALDHAAPAPAANADALAELLALADRIENWQEPRQVRNRTYDDREFVASLRQQFARRQALSERQVAALKKTLAKYHAEFPDFADLAARHGLAAAGAGKPQAGDAAGTPLPTIEEPCPECGKPLAVRRGKRGPFVGCTAYPKCRFVKSMPK